MRNKNDGVAILRLPANAWDAMSPQQQLLVTTQHLIGFIASEAYATFKGLQIQVIDPEIIANCKTVLQIGAKPDNGIVSVN